MKRFGRLFLIMLLLGILFLCAVNGYAATFTVTNANDSGAGSLRQAIADAASGDVITFDAAAFPDAQTGVILLSSGQLSIDKALTIDGDGRVTLDGNNASRVLYISYSTETHFVSVSLKGLQIINGSAGYGAGVYCMERLTVEDCTFSGNQSSLDGGGLHVYYGVGAVSNSLFSNNHALGSSNGGGMALSNQCTYTVNQCTFTGNTANGGGGIYAGSSNLILTNSLLQGNQSGGGGGAVRSYASTTKIINSTLSGNSNSNNVFASALRNHFSEIQIYNSTITAGGQGVGAISNLSSSCAITSTIIAGNEGVDIHLATGDIETYPVTLSNSLVESVDTYTVTDGVDGNIVGHAPELAALADNGGPTLTHALLSSSPAIDAGSNELSLVYDQRGQGFARTLGSGADMGAFEFGNQLVVRAAGAGSGSVSTDPAGISFSYPDSNSGAAVFSSGVVTATALANPYCVAFWDKGQAQNGVLSGDGSNQASCYIPSIGLEKTITATFVFADSDNDGLLDKDEDKDMDGEVDPGETDPNDPDSDNDGVQDGTELGLTLNDVGVSTDLAFFQPDLDPETTTNPLVQDSDEDGLDDGAEDANHNGRMDLGETSAARKSGDLDGDGVLTVEDAILAIQDLVDKPYAGKERYADVDGDGAVSLTEALFVLQSLQ